MGKQWWEYGIEAVITLVATFGGVSWAIWADNKREKEVERRQADYLKQLKERLLFTLLTEIKGVQKFCLDNSGPLNLRSPYSFETKVIESTPEEQIKFIESLQLLYGLYELREHCRGVHQTIEAFTRPNINWEWQEQKRWQANWEEYKNKLNQLTPKLKKLIDEEYTGDKRKSEYSIVFNS